MNISEIRPISADPRHLCHIHQMFLNAMELMDHALTYQERQIVTLHCGLGPAGDVIGFSQLASLFSMKDGAAAKSVYREAIIKTRKAIPGSAFEHWVVSYDRTYHLSQRTTLSIDPYAPIPDWDASAADQAPQITP